MICCQIPRGVMTSLGKTRRPSTKVDGLRYISPSPLPIPAVPLQPQVIGNHRDKLAVGRFAFSVGRRISKILLQYRRVSIAQAASITLRIQRTTWEFDTKMHDPLRSSAPTRRSTSRPPRVSSKTSRTMTSDRVSRARRKTSSPSVVLPMSSMSLYNVC